MKSIILVCFMFYDVFITTHWHLLCFFFSLIPDTELDKCTASLISTAVFRCAVITGLTDQLCMKDFTLGDKICHPNRWATPNLWVRACKRETRLHWDRQTWMRWLVMRFSKRVFDLIPHIWTVISYYRSWYHRVLVKTKETEIKPD